MNGESVSVEHLKVAAVNAPYLAQLQNEIKEILASPEFGGCSADAPAGLDASSMDGVGVVAAFDPTSAQSALTENNVHVCGETLWKIDPLWTPTPNVPYNPSQTNLFIDHYFQQPSYLPFTPVIAISTPDVKEIVDTVGKWKCITPEEPRHAFLKAMHRDKDDPSKAQRWRHIARSTVVEFRVVAPLLIRSHAMQLRENKGVDFVGVKRSLMQRIYEVLGFKAEFVKSTGDKNPSAEKVTAAFVADVQFSPGSEKVNESFVDMALTMENRVLSIDEARELLLRAEVTFLKNPPFPSISQVQAIVSKARTPPYIIWCLASILDTWEDTSDKIPVRLLQGTQKGGGGKGLVDRCNKKRDMLQHFLTTYLDQRAWPSSVKDEMRASLASHKAYRASNGTIAKKADLSWRASWPGSAEDAYQLIESVIYDTVHDEIIDDAVRKHMSVEEMLNTEDFRVLLSEIDSAVKEEKEADEEHRSLAQATTSGARDTPGPVDVHDADKEKDEIIGTKTLELTTHMDDKAKGMVMHMQGLAKKLVSRG